MPAVALVTGGNRGIGQGITRCLLAKGFAVSILATRAEPVEVLADLRELGEVRYVRGSVAEMADHQRYLRDAVDAWGRLDVLVNNAGVGSDFGVSGLDPDFEAIQRALDTNFFGAYRLTVGLLGLLRQSTHPRIVSVSSGMGGVAEMGGWSPGYRVSKAALNAMTRILSTELKDERVLVNSACPGFVNTDMGGPMGATKSVTDGAAGVVWLATLPDDGPTGGFFRDGAPIAF